MSIKTASNSTTTANSPVLTAREKEVLDLLLAGSIPKEIAATLNISYATVLDHQKNLYRKLDVHNINELLTKYNSAVVSDKSVISHEIMPVEIATSQKPLIADFYDNSFYNKETIWQYKITPSIFYSDIITAGERYTLSFSFKSNIAFNFLDLTLIDGSPEANFYTVLAPPSRQFTNSKANTEYKGCVTFSATKNASSAAPQANILQLEINAGKKTKPTLTFTKFELIKGDAEESPVNETKAVFMRWDTFVDKLGSHINLTQKVEKIQGNYTETYQISGNLANKPEVYAGAPAYPDPSTLEAMRNMKSLSFTVLGDGNAYELMIATSETVKVKFNHYRKIFSTENGVISEIEINIDELSQATTFGNETPFISSNIEYFQINPYSKGDFNLKIWDIKFF